MSARKVKLPNVASPPGVLFAITSQAPLSTVYGLFDLEVNFAGSPALRALRVYVDEEQQGDQMTKVGRLRYVHTVETAVFPDGMHQLTVAAFDADDKVIATVSTDLCFRNIQNFNFISLRPNLESTGYDAFIRINTMRAEMPASQFRAMDKIEGRREPLSVEIFYDGNVINGTPMPRLSLQRSKGTTLEDGLHQVQITISDNEGHPCAITSHFLKLGEYFETARSAAELEE